MFGTNFQLPPAIRDYSSAMLRWERTKPKRGDAKDAVDRPLRMKGSRDITRIVRRNDGSIALKYYATDVVTYHPDGSITIRCYSSKTTNEFANRLLPEGVHAAFAGSRGDAPDLVVFGSVWSGRAHQIGSSMRVVKGEDGWCPAPEERIIPFVWPRLNVKRANAAYKKRGLDKFALWVKAYMSLRGLTRDSYNRLYAYPSWELRQMSTDTQRLLALLDAPGEWQTEFDTFGPRLVDWARRAVQKADDCVDVEQHEWIMRDQVSAYMKARRTYPWA
jgi:hypothetical protein